MKPGLGPKPRVGQTVTIQYTGYLSDGEKFDSSRDRYKPFSFVIGEDRVIRGLDEVLRRMNLGSRVKARIPPVSY